jgi:probable blue pigment (indigoidine) exporter
VSAIPPAPNRLTHLPADSAHRLGLSGILLACLSVAASTLVSKALLATLPVLPLVFAQLLVSSIIVWALALSTGRLPSRREAARLALPGILQPGLVYMLAFAGLSVTPVSVEALLFAFEAVLVVLIAWPLLGERPTAGKVALASVGALGVVLIADHDAAGGPTSAVGIALILGGVVAAALDTVVSRAISREADPLAMTAASHIAALILVALTLLVAPTQPWAKLMDWRLLPPLALSGFLLHGFATIVFNFGLARVSAGTAALLFPSISLMTAIGAYAFFGERLAAPQLLGGGLVVIAALGVGFLPSRPGQPVRREGSPRLDAATSDD